MSIDGVSASCVLSTRGTSPPGSRLHVFFAIRAFSDDELSAGTGEEEHNVWKKVWVLCGYFSVGPSFKGHVTDTELERLAMSCHFALHILCDLAFDQCQRGRCERRYAARDLACTIGS